MPVNAILAKATMQPARDQIEVIGSIAARDEITIVSELDSSVVEINVKEGERVEKGQTLFRLDATKTAALLAEAEAAYRLAALSHQRNKDLLGNNTISQQAYDEGDAELKTRKAQLDLARDSFSKTTIAAPFDGVVGERSVSKGQFVTRGQVLLNMVCTDPLDIVGDVPERYLANLGTGKMVEFRTQTFPDRKFDARIEYISPTVDTASRTIRIKATFINSEGLLMPGMFGNLSIILGENTEALIIPESCLKMEGSHTTVVRVNKDGFSEFVPVETGARMKGMVYVLSGLTEGDHVVAEGWQKMGPGSKVIAAPGSEKYGVTAAIPEEAPNADI